MNFKYFLLFFFLFSCTTNNVKKSDNIIFEDSFVNIGFTLVYDESLKKKKIITKKIDDRSLIIFQKNLKKDTLVKITNLINNKSILAKVGSNSEYPDFYNSVISQRIYKELEIDIDEPYIQLLGISEKSIFFAKKAKTYAEEKNVANKAPVDEINIKNLNINPKKIINNDKKEFNYIIKIADFYYEDTAKSMIIRIEEETEFKKAKINKISNNQFRVFLGPFNNINSLQTAFNVINILQFENIEIIKK